VTAPPAAERLPGGGRIDHEPAQANGKHGRGLKRRAYRAASCSRISAIKASGLHAFIVALGAPVGRAHHTTWLGQHRTAQRSHCGYFGRSIASCSSTQSVTQPA